MKGDDAAGVLLTIKSRLPQTGRIVVNLSSWYVEPSCRWFAPRMLQMASSNEDEIFTDLTPSPEACKLNERLGFATVTDALCSASPGKRTAAGARRDKTGNTLRRNARPAGRSCPSRLHRGRDGGGEPPLPSGLPENHDQKIAIRAPHPLRRPAGRAKAHIHNRPPPSWPWPACADHGGNGRRAKGRRACRT